jgi:membrane fusion protein, multidrug efflux system
MRNTESAETPKRPPQPKAMPQSIEAAPEAEAGDEMPVPPKRRLWWIVGGVAVALVVLWLVRGQIAPFLPAPIAGLLGGAPKAGFAPPPRLVGAAKVMMKSVPVQVSAIGSIDAFRTVSVKSRVDGQVVAVKFKQGDAVRVNDVLFQLDDRPAKSALDQAQAALSRDTATLDNQQREFTRQEQLLAAKISTQQDYDAARTAVAVTTQTIASDKAAIDNARLTLDYDTIRAPIPGRTGKVLIDLGNVVKANDTVSMVTINQIQPVYVTFSVPQRYLVDIRQRYRAGQLPVTVTAPESAKPLAEGRLDFVDNAVDTSTGTIALRAIFQNESEALWPGQFVNTTLVLHDDPTALTVPPEAVQTGREGAFVYVVKDDNTVNFRAITVDRIVAGSAVISKGLAEGETVVTDGQLNLVEGSRVAIAGQGAPGGKPGGAGGAGTAGAAAMGAGGTGAPGAGQSGDGKGPAGK